jgi:hypothetical protein
MCTRDRKQRSCSFVVFAIALAVMCAALPAAASTQLVWARTHDSGDNFGATAVAVAADPGNGHVYVLARDDCCPLSTYDTLAYSSAGTLLWHATSSTAEDLPAGILVDPATHDVVVTGSRNRNRHTMYTIGYSSSGAVLWTRQLFPASGRAISVAGIADDGHGRVDVVGTTTAGGVGDYLTAAYRISNGTTLWHTRYAGPDGDSEAIAIAADPGKDRVYVTGTSLGTNFPELTTVAYSGTTGAQVWADRDTGSDDVALGLAVDTGTHQVYAVASNSGLMAIHAYSAAGTELWNSGYGQPNAVPGYPRAGLAVDSSTGQVYVSGDDEVAGGNVHTVLAAYSSTGTLKWSRNVHTGSNDLAWDVTVDPTNHRAYVAGERAASGGTNLVFATYAESSSGTSVWTATHASPQSGQDAEPAAITADPTKKQVYVAGYEQDQTSLVTTLAYKA